MTNAKPMEPAAAWQYAASWGSFITAGDPGACMYGFDERFRMQSENHRAAVLAWIETSCKPMVIERPDDYPDDELEQMAAFVAAVRVAPVDQ